MSRMEDLELYANLAGLLARPNHGYVSWNGLGKRLRLNDDKPRRAVTRLEETFRAALVESRGGRLALTPAGQRVYSHVERLLALRTSFEDVDQFELLTVEADDDLAAWLLPRVLPGFLTNFSEFVQLRTFPLDANRVRANIAAGLTGFGLGIDFGDSPTAEPLEPGIGWHLIVHPSHRLSSLEPDERPQLGPVDRVFLASGKSPPETEAFVDHVPRPNRIECGSFYAVRACVAAGHGVGIIPSFVTAPDAARSFPLAGLSDLRVVLYLPRDDESFSDPARAMVAAIRASIEQLVPPAAVTDAPDDSGAADPELCEVGGENP